MKLAIYGAQGIALGAYEALHNICPDREIICFLVTKREMNAEYLAGIPVLETEFFSKSLSDQQKQELEILMEGKAVEKPVYEDITYDGIYNSVSSLWNYMFFSGYFRKEAERMDENLKQVFAVFAIPNEEVRMEFLNAIEGSGWNEVISAVEASEKLLQATLQKDEHAVAKAIDRVHMDTTSILNYNDENALSYVISLAYYSARKDYFLIRELPSGKGYADIVFLPRKRTEKPAMVIELKWDHSADAAISQIKRKQYTSALEEYRGNLLLVGINYQKETKEHQCIIEEWKK